MFVEYVSTKYPNIAIKLTEKLSTKYYNIMHNYVNL